MRVLFKLRKNKRNGAARATIYCRIKVEGTHANDFTTYIYLAPDDWDADAQRIKGRGIRSHDDNLKLTQINSDITRLFLQFQSSDETLSAQRLADLYTGKQKQTHTFWELVDLFEQHINDTYRNKGTRKNYKIRIDNIRLFLTEKKLTKLPADRFILGTADEFVRWAKVKGLDHQYIVRHTQVLKNITEDAVRREIMPIDKLSAFKLKKREKINTAHLTKAEIELIDEYNWRPPVRRIVDLFLFSCYTGLHYADAQTLQADEVREGIDGRLWLFKPRGKYAESDFFVHESVQVVPLSPQALKLIEKYGGVDRLPKISNKGYNDYLKQIGYMAGIKLFLSVRIARKTFTDVMLNELNVSEESVAAMLGHATTRHVRYYGRAGERRVANEVKWEE